MNKVNRFPGTPPTLVTGSSGQLGSYIVEKIREANGTALGLDVRPSIATDYTQNILAPYEGPAVGAIVHCAAQVSVAVSVDRPRFDAENNVIGTIAALDLARKFDARFVFISSAAVYGPDAQLPTSESAGFAPISPYGLSKVAGEHYVNLFRSLYGLETTILRPFNIFSKRQDPTNPYSGVISKFCARLAAGESPLIFGDGMQTRDFVHATDVVQAVILSLASDRAVGETFNVGTGISTTISEIAEILRTLVGGTTPPLEYAATRQADIRHSLADISKLRTIGFQPHTIMSEHLKEMIVR